MAIDNATVLQNLKVQRAEVEKNLDVSREMYLKLIGAIEVLEQIEAQNSVEPEGTEEAE